MNSFSIRQAGPEDVDQILSFIRLLAEYEHMASEVVATKELLHEWLFQKKTAYVLIAECEGKPVGFALYFFNFSTFLGRGGIYLEDLFVLPEYRGRGIGHALLRRLAAIAMQNGCGRLEWWCLDWNTPSIAFYRSVGAVSMEEWTTWRVTGNTLCAMAAEDGAEQ